MSTPLVSIYHGDVGHGPEIGIHDPESVAANIANIVESIKQDLAERTVPPDSTLFDRQNFIAQKIAQGVRDTFKQGANYVSTIKPTNNEVPGSCRDASIMSFEAAKALGLKPALLSFKWAGGVNLLPSEGHITCFVPGVGLIEGQAGLVISWDDFLTNGIRHADGKPKYRFITDETDVATYEPITVGCLVNLSDDPNERVRQISEQLQQVIQPAEREVLVSSVFGDAGDITFRNYQAEQKLRT